MLRIFNKEHRPIGYIRKYKDLQRVRELATADRTLSFTYLAYTHEIDYEYYIQDKEDEYVVKEIRESSDGFPQYTAVLNTEELDGKTWEKFLVKDATPREAANLALAGTGWRVEECSIERRRNMGIAKTNSRMILEKICTVFLCEMVLDSKKKTVSFLEKVGQDKGVYFIRGLNLKSASVTGDTYGYYTRIIPIGKDGLKISEVNGGKDYLENHQYSKKNLTYIWEDTTYEDANALKEDAEKKLEDLSKPKKSYSVRVRDLARQRGEYSILQYSIGDTVTLIDSVSGIRDKQRIMKITEYPQKPEENTCELANTRLSFEELQQKLREAASIMEAVTNSDGTINGGTVDKITIEQIWGIKEEINKGVENSEAFLEVSGDIVNITKELNAVKITVGELDVTYLKATEAELKYATIQNLKAQEAEVHSLKADYGSFKTLTAEELSANKAQIGEISGNLAEYKKVVAGELEAVTGKFESLSTKYAAIDLANIAVGTIKTAMIDRGAIQSAQIADGAITNLKVAGDLDATKITAGTLSVDRLIIRGNEKSLVYELNNITGALQAKDVDTLNGEILTPRTINADRIIANSITGNEIKAKTITANNIVANSITGSEIAASAITSEKIAANAVTATKIATDAIKSRNYTYSSGNYSTAGTFFDLSNGVIRSKNFGIDANGSAYFKGNLAGASGSFSGEIKATSGSISGSIITQGINANNITVGTLKADRIDVSGVFAKDITATGTIRGVNLIGAKGEFTGSITATSGKIGGWSITSSGIDYTTSAYSVHVIPGTNGNKDFLVVNNRSNNTTPFFVRADGLMRAAKAEIVGNITAQNIWIKNTLKLYTDNTTDIPGKAVTALHTVTNDLSKLYVGQGFSQVHFPKYCWFENQVMFAKTANFSSTISSAGNITITKVDPYVYFQNSTTGNIFGLHSYTANGSTDVFALYDKKSNANIFQYSQETNKFYFARKIGVVVDSQSWLNGAKGNAALNFSNTGTGWYPVINQQGMDGAWEQGYYSTTKAYHFTFVSNANINAGTNAGIGFEFRNAGTFYAPAGMEIGNNVAYIGRNTNGEKMNLARVGNNNYAYLSWDGCGCTVLMGAKAKLASASGTVITSDRRLKHNVSSIKSAYLKAFMDLDVVNFRYNKNGDREHVGLIYQDAKAVMEKYGIFDFAGIDDPDLAARDEIFQYGGIIYEQFSNIHMAVTQELVKAVRILNEDIRSFKSKEENLSNIFENRMKQTQNQLSQACAEIVRLKTVIENLEKQNQAQA